MRLTDLLTVAAVALALACGQSHADEPAAADAAAAAGEEAAGDEGKGGGEHAHGPADHGVGENAAGGESKPDPLAFDLDLAWFTLVVFVALATLLRVVAWDPIVKALQAREDGIAGEIAAASAKHEEAKALYEEHAAKVAAATDEVKGMLEEARRDAEVTKATIIDEARQAADAEKHRAIRDVEQARDSAIKQLAEESAHLAIDLAGKVVKQEISPERQGEIVREAIGRLASAEPSSN